MTYYDRLVVVLNLYKGVFWAILELDVPEWTVAQYMHQN